MTDHQAPEANDEAEETPEEIHAMCVRLINQGTARGLFYDAVPMISQPPMKIPIVAFFLNLDIDQDALIERVPHIIRMLRAQADRLENDLYAALAVPDTIPDDPDAWIGQGVPEPAVPDEMPEDWETP